MENKREYLGRLYEKIAETIDISEASFKKAELHYKALGKHLDKNIADYNVEIYPQGSFALGTVVKPLNEDDDYDLDLVCEFEEAYDYSAEELKVEVVGSLIKSYGTIKGIEEKKRCWQVTYEESSQFHMDVIPAVYPLQKGLDKKAEFFSSITESVHDDFRYDKSVAITDKDEDKNTYKYIGSNPRGYLEWFNKRQEVVRNRVLLEKRAIYDSVETVPNYDLKTPLQKAIQILKRHRDKMFEDDESNKKPISIIITTLAAHSYNGEDNLFDAVCTILGNMQNYISSENGIYRIENPSYPAEDFADKWKEFPDRKDAFFSWLGQAQKDLITSLLDSGTFLEFADNLKPVLGDAPIKKAFASIGKEFESYINDDNYRVDAKEGIIFNERSSAIRQNHHFGQEDI